MQPRGWLCTARAALATAGTTATIATAVPAESAARDLDDLDGGVEAAPDAEDPLARGKYVLFTAGCITCHTADADDAVPLAGGRALETDFGTFQSPNITPHDDTGLGTWQREDMHAALKEGLAPDGAPYYPAFPYTSYTAMAESDIDDLFAYLQALEPVENAVPDHDLDFPYSIRMTLWPWRWLYFETEGIVRERPDEEGFNRGAYLVNALGHCGECHTPRNWLGAMDRDRHLAGNPEGPEERSVPNITPHEDGIGDWSRRDITFLLQTGFYPDGDVVGGGMGAVVRDNTSKLTDADRDAIADYLRAIEALPETE